MDEDKNTCLQQAIQMEEDGKEFYLRAVSNVTSPSVRMIFEELARQEDFHIRKIREIFAAMQKAQALREWITCVIPDSRPPAFFGEEARDQAKASSSDLEALRFALQVEEKGIKYYEDLAARSQDKYEKRFYLTLSQEERGHYLRIMDSIEWLSDPEGWNYIKGRGMVDGG